MNRGWALGSEAFKQDLLANHSVALEARAWPERGAAEVRKQRWQMALNEALSRVPCDTREAAHKSAPWKVAIAAHLKAMTDVSNGSLAQQRGMGSACYLSKQVGRVRMQSKLASPFRDQFNEVKGKA